MYERTRRARTLVTAFLLAALGGAAWGQAADPGKYVKLTKSYKLGVTSIHVDAVEGVTAAVVKQTLGGVTTYYLPKDAGYPSVSAETAAPLSAAPTPTSLATGLEEGYAWATARLDGGSATSSPGRALGHSDARMTLPLRSYGVPVRYELTWRNKAGLLRRLTLDGVGEFVREEQALFQKLPEADRALPYATKAYALLSKVLPAGELATALTAIRPGHGMKLGIFDGLTGDEVYKRVSGRVLASIGRHFLTSPESDDSVDELKLQILDLDGAGFDQLYGPAQTRNPWISGYAEFCFAKSKPILSYPARRALEKKEIAYSYAQYQTISAGNGTALADRALRYLTGAVEYAIVSPGSDERASDQTSGADRAVYKENAARIAAWVGAGAGIARDDNYLAGGFLNDLRTQTGGILSPGAGGLSLKTPFLRHANGSEGLLGNPLPFAPYGIDTPRSFAYKLWEQQRAREWYARKGGYLGQVSLGLEYTLSWVAASTNPNDAPGAYTSYRSASGKTDAGAQFDPFGTTIRTEKILKAKSGEAPYAAGETIKPFLPGAEPGGNPKDLAQSKSYYRPDSVAGIDSAGILAGSLAMTSSLDGVADARNRRVGRWADGYSRLAPGAIAEAKIDGGNLTLPALDAAGKPAYYVEGLGSRLASEAYSLSMSDIERMSVLIPDLSLLRKGDLIVRRDETGRPHVGIVVNLDWTTAPAYGGDGRSQAPQVTVVSVRRGTLVASMSSWGNGGGLFGGFSANPERYQARRLVSYVGGAAPAEPLAWEAVKSPIDRVELTIVSREESTTSGMPENPQASWRWIPNTGEGLILGISAQAKLRDGEYSSEGLSGKGVKIKLTDYGAKAVAPAGSGNIYNNLGAGIEFGYVATAGGTKTYEWLYRRTRSGDAYVDSYRESYFTATGENKPGSKSRLEFAEGGSLRFSPGKGEYSEFYLRPASPENLRPGDDYEFSLEVDLEDKKTATKAVQPRFAIYDKKMLWRANLYIDEGDNNDWNSIHPWVAGNEWNKDNSGALVGDLAKAGKQNLRFPPFTMKWDDAALSSKTAQNNVGYFIDGFDSPFQFSNKLNQQQGILNQWYVDNVSTKLNSPIIAWGNYSALTNLSDLYSLTFGSEVWDTIITKFSSLADVQKRQQIINKMNSWADGGATSQTTEAPTKTWAKYEGELWNGNAYNIGSQNYYPFRPGLAAEFDVAQRGKITGTDCVGFVQRAACYNGNLYPWVTIAENTLVNWGDTGSRGFGYPTTANSIVLATNTPSEPGNINPSIPNLKYLIPGDVVRFADKDGDPLHFAMVQNVLPNVDGTVSLAGVVLIESTHKSSNPLITGAYVGQTMSTYEARRYDGSSYRSWNLYRLKVNP